ncbi:ANG2 [Acanthosepion pharaonis]|uniref:Vacuolar protein sorting-associated protein 51 homolog n=1 Tax=Acanthosepion pharaonis TaxID=158019 RepID=A0A812B870_ACAPH|nr:ANG2 [Sepia pharaonis]
MSSFNSSILLLLFLCWSLVFSILQGLVHAVILCFSREHVFFQFIHIIVYFFFFVGLLQGWLAWSLCNSMLLWEHVFFQFIHIIIILFVGLLCSVLQGTCLLSIHPYYYYYFFVGLLCFCPAGTCLLSIHPYYYYYFFIWSLSLSLLQGLVHAMCLFNREPFFSLFIILFSLSLSLLFYPAGSHALFLCLIICPFNSSLFLYYYFSVGLLSLSDIPWSMPGTCLLSLSSILLLLFLCYCNSCRAWSTPVILCLFFFISILLLLLFLLVSYVSLWLGPVLVFSFWLSLSLSLSLSLLNMSFFCLLPIIIIIISLCWSFVSLLSLARCNSMSLGTTCLLQFIHIIIIIISLLVSFLSCMAWSLSLSLSILLLTFLCWSLCVLSQGLVHAVFLCTMNSLSLYLLAFDIIISLLSSCRACIHNSIWEQLSSTLLFSLFWSLSLLRALLNSIDTFWDMSFLLSLSIFYFEVSLLVSLCLSLQGWVHTVVLCFKSDMSPFFLYPYYYSLSLGLSLVQSCKFSLLSLSLLLKGTVFFQLIHIINLFFVGLSLSVLHGFVHHVILCFSRNMSSFFSHFYYYYYYLLLSLVIITCLSSIPPYLSLLQGLVHILSSMLLFLTCLLSIHPYYAMDISLCWSLCSYLQGWAWSMVCPSMLLYLEHVFFQFITLLLFYFFVGLLSPAGAWGLVTILCCKEHVFFQFIHIIIIISLLVSCVSVFPRLILSMSSFIHPYYYYFFCWSCVSVLQGLGPRWLGHAVILCFTKGTCLLSIIHIIIIISLLVSCVSACRAWLGPHVILCFSQEHVFFQFIHIIIIISLLVSLCSVLQGLVHAVILCFSREHVFFQFIHIIIIISLLVSLCLSLQGLVHAETCLLSPIHPFIIIIISFVGLFVFCPAGLGPRWLGPRCNSILLSFSREHVFFQFIHIIIIISFVGLLCSVLQGLVHAEHVFFQFIHIIIIISLLVSYVLSCRAGVHAGLVHTVIPASLGNMSSFNSSILLLLFLFVGLCVLSFQFIQEHVFFHYYYYYFFVGLLCSVLQGFSREHVFFQFIHIIIIISLLVSCVSVLQGLVHLVILCFSREHVFFQFIHPYYYYYFFVGLLCSGTCLLSIHPYYYYYFFLCWSLVFCPAGLGHAVILCFSREHVFFQFIHIIIIISFVGLLCSVLQGLVHAGTCLLSIHPYYYYYFFVGLLCLSFGPRCNSSFSREHVFFQFIHIILFYLLVSCVSVLQGLVHAGTCLLSIHPYYYYYFFVGLLCFCPAGLGSSLVVAMLRKSVETRDWLNTIEPRNVRAVMKRVVEDITAIDVQVGQLYEEGVRKERSSDSSRRTHSYSLSQQQRRTQWNFTPSIDNSLISNIQKLFSEKIEIFSAVEFSKVSVLTGIIKISLKTFLECVRLRTFGRYGLQQIQVDTHYLQLYLWRFVSDENLVQVLLDEIVCSTAHRCLDPSMMEPSVIELICERG